MACDAKHTKYQPPLEAWKCPNCGLPPPEGICVDEGPNMECDLLHEEDGLVCYGAGCGYGTSGKAFAARLQKTANLVPCAHCKGTGLVKAK